MSDIRLVVADRSASIRAVVRRMLERDGVRVVGETHSGREVVSLLDATGADGLVADLDLDELAGRELVEAVAGVRSIPVFVLTPTVHTPTTRIAFGAHDLGVVSVSEKPSLPDQWADFGDALRTSVLEVCAAARASGVDAEEPDDTPVIGPNLRFAAIGASAGGPGALVQLLRAFGGRQPLGIAIVQHIAAGFETVLGEWLAAETGLDVAVGRDGEVLTPGRVRLAPAGNRMTLGSDGSLRVEPSQAGDSGDGQSIAGLFESLRDHPPASVAAVLLSGMGSDGARAMSRLKEAGVLTIAQDRESSAVYGMPRVAVESGAATISMKPGQIGRLLSRAAGAGR